MLKKQPAEVFSAGCGKQPISNDEVIKELLKAAGLIAKAHQAGEALGLTQEELAFYDALTRPQAIKDFYENDVLYG